MTFVGSLALVIFAVFVVFMVTVFIKSLWQATDPIEIQRARDEQYTRMIEENPKRYRRAVEARRERLAAERRAVGAPSSRRQEGNTIPSQCPPRS